MELNLLEQINCPTCQADLKLTNRASPTENAIQAGSLACENSHYFEIRNGIPRLLNLSEAQHARASFSFEWECLPTDEFAWGLVIAARQRLFEKCVGFEIENLKEKRILDIGCGNGEVELALRSSGAEVISMDLSSSVDRVQKRIKGALENGTVIHVIQANLSQLPLKSRNFDIVHCAGVLHHTANTFESFRTITKAVKPGGLCFIEVYSNDHKDAVEKVQYHVFEFLRKFTVHLPHRYLNLFCYALAPFFWSTTKLLNTMHVQQRYLKRSFKELKLSMFDALSPLYAWHHTTDEVTEWFTLLGFKDIKKTFSNHNVIGIVGRHA